MVYGMFLPGRNFMSGLLCILKPKKCKEVQTFSKKPSFFPALD